jgi:hypothetical protein
MKMNLWIPAVMFSRLSLSQEANSVSNFFVHETLEIKTGILSVYFHDSRGFDS